RLQTGPGRALRHRLQSSLYPRQHADPALRLDADLQGPVQRVHGPAAPLAPRRQPRGRDVPHAALGRLAGLRLRLRFQPDAGAAAAARRPQAPASFGPDRARSCRQPDRRARPLLWLHRGAGVVVQRRIGRQLRGVNEGIEKEGAFYLFSLCLIPVIPFFVINLAMGLTPLRARTFYWVSQLGMLAGTLVYVNAGTQLAKIAAPGDILSWQRMGAFLLLGFFPLLAKKTVDGVKARRVYARWKRPAKLDRNLVVIGAGSAGLVAAYIAAAVRAKVTLVEKHRMGGDCLNTGCVPSKALIKSARVLSQIRKADEFGLRNATAEVDFAGVMERVQRVIKAVEP